MDYELARVTGQPGDIYIFDDASTESAPDRIPRGQDVIHTTFPRRGNLRGRPCHKAFWELYMRLLDEHGATHIFEVPPDVIITRPELFTAPAASGAYLVGVARAPEPTVWNQWGCGQIISRDGLRLALDRLDGDPDLETVNHNMVTFQDVAISWLLRDKSVSLSWFRACFTLKGNVPNHETAFVNFDNFDRMDRHPNVRRQIAIADALAFRKRMDCKILCNDAQGVTGV